MLSRPTAETVRVEAETGERVDGTEPSARELDPPTSSFDRIRSLAVMARALGRSADLRTMLETAAEEALPALGAASVSVSRVEAGTGTIRTIINVGDLAPHEQRWPTDEVYGLHEFTQLASVLEDLKPWTASVDDPDSDPNEVGLLRSLGKATALAAPMIVDGVLWGEFYATRHAGVANFAEIDTAYSEALVAILAGAISRAQQEEALGRLAYRDSLTGLANRRALDEAAVLAMSVAAEGTQEVTVVMADVNGLKLVNDTVGHDAGDGVLRAVSAILQRHIGVLHGSLIARLGGDEFAALVPGQPLDRVMAAALAACEAAEQLPYGAGLSCGVASTSFLPGASAAELFRAADRAQYLAKSTGGSAARLAAGRVVRPRS
jgi:diguanylate cyclase (GGDEF)-like protein